MNHIINIVLISLFCIGWCRLLMPGMILDNFGYFLEKYLGKYWSKPFGLCIPCSASLIGSFAYLLLILANVTIYNFWNHIFYCVSAVGMNLILWFVSEILVYTYHIKKKQFEDLNNPRKCLHNCVKK